MKKVYPKGAGGYKFKVFSYFVDLPSITANPGAYILFIFLDKKKNMQAVALGKITLFGGVICLRWFGHGGIEGENLPAFETGQKNPLAH